MRFFWLLLFIVFRYGESNERLQPDILLVVADDAGHADVGWYNEKMRSPFLDSLANDEKRTIRFDRFYAYPTCSPTRGALMSGRYAHENSLTFAVIGPRSISGVNPKLPFFTKSLKRLGYATHLVGKWHCGHAKRAYLPTSRGFDTFFGLLGGGFHHGRKLCPMNLSTSDLWNGTTRLNLDDERMSVDIHATDLFADEASRIVKSSTKRQDRKPLFLMLSYTAVHDPLVVSEKYVKPCSHHITRRRREMCSMMLQLDQGTKKVVESFDNTDNLVIMFMSDNGGFNFGGGLNYPLRGVKTGVFEGGIRTWCLSASLSLSRKSLQHNHIAFVRIYK